MAEALPPLLSFYVEHGPYTEGLRRCRTCGHVWMVTSDDNLDQDGVHVPGEEPEEVMPPSP